MNKFIVGASVAIKWFIPEIHAEAASRLLQGDAELISPELTALEFAALLYKKMRLEEITEQEARDVLAGFQVVPLRVESTLGLTSLAFEVASDIGLDFYDSLYVAMAIHHHCPVVSADRNLYDKLIEGPYSKNIMWVEDIP